MTLNALATALEGRGEELGENLETLDTYLKRLNPQIPQIVDDLRLTAAGVRHLRRRDARDRARSCATRSPPPARSRTRTTRSAALYEDVAAFSDTSRDFLDANGDNLIRLGELGAAAAAGVRQVRAGVPLPAQGHRQRRRARRPRPSVASPSTSCSRRCPNQPRGYNAGRQAALRRDPRPELPQPAEPAVEPGATRCGTSPTSTTASTSRPARAPAGSRRRTTRPGTGYAGSAGRGATCSDALLAPGLGVTADEDVPDLGPLLVGPMARGAEVSLR